MPRLMLNDEFWSKLKKIQLQESIYNKRNLRLTVEGILYRMRVGCPWRDLPKAFGCWNSIYKRFNAWSLSKKWLNIFKALSI
ncbi:MAG: transposase, partial [Nitrosomonas halophila]